MYHLNDLKLAIRIADLQNISAASRELNLTPAAASAALKRLEQRLNCQLFVRSTRNMQLTEEGHLFIESSREAIKILELASNTLNNNNDQLSGDLGLSMPSDLGRNIVSAWLDEFLASAPSLTLTLYLSDHMSDLMDQKIQLALRYGHLADSALKRRYLTSSPRYVVASPTYIEEFGQPNSPAELQQHKLLNWNLGSKSHQQWAFNKDNQRIQVSVTPIKTTNDGALLREWAILGHGIAYKSWIDIAEDVEQGRLKVLLTDYLTEDIPLQLVYLQTDYPRKQLRMVIDFLQHKFSEFSKRYPPP
ncbi:LysR family transcriptional regulator [Psychromonas sp. SR45-3]|uniref:LysR family transcriptional regulator n=1 Tax=Psychromonas sp. SR45-3 TaxID=2760930 RepID=UPI0015F88721|nr:LysR family transcriptional regulator [Psychromonas sp. SR45-3]MBB1272250.1 LysR family transcriptional regulator [Psychromonas sp. SR45-3]